MPIVSLRIPQIGEGLQEARLVAFLKQPGDTIKRDEPIYQMETDKAVMDVESPYDGVLVEWLVDADSVLPIGGEVGRVEATGEVQEMTVHGAPETTATTVEAKADTSNTKLAGIPPRTRAYAKEKGVSDADLATVPSAGSKLMPSDIDAFLASAPASTSKGFTETALSGKQRLLSSRLVRGSQLVVPGTMSVHISWEAIENKRAQLKSAGGDFQPSSFTMFAYAVAQALKDFPMFRSSLVGDDKLRTYDHVNLGIAVSLPGDELVLAVIEEADNLDWPTFARTMREKIELARTGKDQANESVTISLTNMQNFGIRDAVAVVVPPAVATMFLGEVFNGLDPQSSEPVIKRYATMGLTFDHRLINGVGAAQFMKSVKDNAERLAI